MLRLTKILHEGKGLSELSTYGCVAREERQLTYRRKSGYKSRHIHFIVGHSPVELMPIGLCLTLQPAGDIYPSRWQEKFQRVPAINEEMSNATLQRSVIRLTGERLDE